MSGDDEQIGEGGEGGGRNKREKMEPEKRESNKRMMTGST